MSPPSPSQEACSQAPEAGTGPRLPLLSGASVALDGPVSIVGRLRTETPLPSLPFGRCQETRGQGGWECGVPPPCGHGDGENVERSPAGPSLRGPFCFLCTRDVDVAVGPHTHPTGVHVHRWHRGPVRARVASLGRQSLFCASTGCSSCLSTRVCPLGRTASAARWPSVCRVLSDGLGSCPHDSSAAQPLSQAAGLSPLACDCEKVGPASHSHSGFGVTFHSYGSFPKSMMPPAPGLCEVGGKGLGSVVPSPGWGGGVGGWRAGGGSSALPRIVLIWGAEILI